MEKSFQLIFNGKDFKIPYMFKHLIEVSPKITESLIFSQSHQYQVESKVSEEVFQSFLNYFVNDEIPNIDIDNINDFIQLSQEFHLLDDIIQSKISQFGEYLVNLNCLLSENKDKSDSENQIALKLDEYLVKYGKKLMNSPIQSLFNIFNNKMRNLTDHNLAYDLIKNHFKSTGDLSIFVLLDSLDGTKLSQSNVEESILLKNERMNHAPSIDLTFLSNAFDSQKKFKSKIEELEEKVIQMQNVNQLNIKNLTEKHENDMKNLTEKHENDMKKLIEKHENDMKKLIEKHENDIKTITEKYELLNKKIIETNENERKIFTQKYENDKQALIEKHDKDIKMLTEKFELDMKKITDKIENDYKELIKKYSNEVEELKKTIDTKEKQINELQEKTKETIIQCKYEGDELCGIISYFRKKYGNDFQNKGIMKFSDAGLKNSRPIINLFSYDSDHINDLYENQFLGTVKQPDGWVEVDFVENKINLTSYTIRTSNSSTDGYNHPKSWRICGSNDRKKWDTLNQQVNSSLLNGEYFQHRFECDYNQNFYRYIRYIQDSAYHSDYPFNIVLTCFELFGSIKLVNN